MSAVVGDDADGPPDIINVLLAVHDGVDMLDFGGPLEALTTALHNKKDESSKAFDCTIAGPADRVTSEQGCTFVPHISLKEAHSRLTEFDVLVIPGGNSAQTLKSCAEPMAIIQAFAELQKQDSSRERTLMSICTGGLFLARAGVLQGMSATTHPDFYIHLENICQTASASVAEDRTDVMEERYVVNNGRFDIGDIEENPFVWTRDEIMSRKEKRQASMGRKGSKSLRESNTRKESNARRAALRLGGLRVITAGGITSGIDASLYLISALVSAESAVEVARMLQHDWQKGVVVDAIDV